MGFKPPGTPAPGQSVIQFPSPCGVMGFKLLCVFLQLHILYLGFRPLAG